MLEEVNIPEERKAALIGKEGASKDELEGRTSTRISIRESVVVSGRDPIQVMKAGEVVKAVGRGFAPEKAMLLLNEDYELRVISLREESDKAVKRLMARVIGRRGATRKILEKETNCMISVYGRTVAIIGTHGEIGRAQEAVEELLKGRSHGRVYARIRK